jgi:ABC-type multidrug transport system fused ATPase/permease subunit
MISVYEGYGNTYEPVSIYACHTYKRAVTSMLQYFPSTFRVVADQTDSFDSVTRSLYITIYVAATGAILVLMTGRAFLFFHYCMRIGVNIHNRMFSSLIHSPINFFDKNPSGRIMNRFTKDLGSMDDALQPAFYEALSIMLLMVGVLVVVIFSNYFMAIPTLPILIILWWIRRFYIKTARDIKRVEAVGTKENEFYKILWKNCCVSNISIKCFEF